MHIIEINVLENGAHRNQIGDFNIIPEGWAIIHNNIEIPETFPFVIFDIDENNNVINLEANWNAYIAAIKASKEEIKSTPSIQDDIDTMLVDHEYRLTMLELFSETSV